MADVAAVRARERLVAALCLAAVDLTQEAGFGHASVARATGGRLAGVLHATSDAARDLVDLQETLGEGPSLLALEAGRPLLLPDLAANSLASLWLLFRPEAAERGVATVYAFPLQFVAIQLGVLTLHGSRPADALDEVRLTRLLGLRDSLALTLLAPAGDDVPGRWGDLLVHQHATTHQAAGMVMAQLGTTMEDAFVRMQAHALGAGATLADVAADVVGRRISFRPDDTRWANGHDRTDESGDTP